MISFTICIAHKCIQSFCDICNREIAFYVVYPSRKQILIGNIVT